MNLEMEAFFDQLPQAVHDRYDQLDRELCDLMDRVEDNRPLYRKEEEINELLKPSLEKWSKRNV